MSRHSFEIVLENDSDDMVDPAVTQECEDAARAAVEQALLDETGIVLVPKP